MLVAIITVLAIFIFTQFILSISYWDMKRKRKVYIREKFGSIPKAREWNENRRNYCDLFPDDISVDDITWNDLSMDQVFDRINQCDTSAGEEILYWRLRRNGMDTDERALFEKRVEAFDRDERLRESVEDLLCDMGNFLCVDEAPEHALSRLAPRAFYAHAKDFLIKSGSGDAPGSPFFQSRGGNYLRGTVIGHGVVPVRQCLTILKNAGYDGPVGIEFEGMEPVLEGIEAGVKNLRRFLEQVK